MKPLLFVEDHPDIREALTEFLQHEGYDVTTAASAEEGLGHLTTKTFAGVLSDVGLPDQSGVWMLEEARRRGLLQSTAALLITATPHAAVGTGIRTLAKPVDLDELLQELEAMVGPATPHAVEELLPVSRVELVLYVSPSSAHCIRAQRNLRGLLERYPAAQVHLTVRDVSEDHGARAEEDRVWVTPTLVQKHPAPRTWIMGDLSSTGPVERLLSNAGVYPAHPRRD